MARSIVLRLGDEESAFAFAKVERDKLYGRKQRVVVDEQNRACAQAYLTADGTALVPTGGTAHVWIDERWDAVEQDGRLPVDEAGQALELHPSTLGVAQDASVVDPKRVLDHVTSAIYQLDAEAISPKLEDVLAKGGIVEVPFCYRDGFDQDVLFVLKNDEGYFAMVAQPTGFEMLEREALPLAIEPSGEESDELSDDLDFSMM
ncbi:hypothetical protein [Sandaracinus amylolyticus]|uniref:Uncharacterized protein n=1 Tax=Sandaracinus amylolyticus TaxID=927083 RepID=A0A0F6SEQ3_9BACT|nr:hypothetical protein [Sandaracinus amylolyticus]AKF05594.1 hypothetical protein DB32_002743 [Sandaracinus amylolyticus]